MFKNCVVSGSLNNNEVSANIVANPPVAYLAKRFTTGAIYKVLNNAKRYVPVITLYINDNIFRKHKARI